MLGMRKSLLFTLAVALITVSLSKQDCASCCHGKWIACFTGCQTMKACASQCNTGLEICQNGCPGSCSVYDPPSFHKQNLVPGTRSNNRPQNLKMKKILNKLVKKIQRKSGSHWRNSWTLLTWKAACQSPQFVKGLRLSMRSEACITGNCRFHWSARIELWNSIV